MNTEGTKSRVLTVSAVTGALYAVLTLIAAPISYGPVQLRVSEALCVLPFLFPQSAWGLFAGCFLANLMTGNIFDIIFGSLATLFAGLLTGYFGKRSLSMRSLLCSCFFTVLINALVIAAIITCAYEGLAAAENIGIFAVNALWLALGEAAAVFGLGIPLVKILIKKDVFPRKNT